MTDSLSLVHDNQVDSTHVEFRYSNDSLRTDGHKDTVPENTKVLKPVSSGLIFQPAKKEKKAEHSVDKENYTTAIKEQQSVVRVQRSALDTQKDWLSGIVVLAVVALGFLRISSYKYLKELFSATFYFNVANKLFTSVNIRNSFPSIALDVLFLLNTGVFLFEAMVFFERSIFNLSGIVLLLVIIGVIVVYGGVKRTVYLMVGYVFDKQVAVREYLYNASLLSKVYGILLVPIIAIVPYVHALLVSQLIKIGAGLFILLFVIQLIRGGRIILQQSLSIFYLFLYFCALEILPLLILYKVLL